MLAVAGTVLIVLGCLGLAFALLVFNDQTTSSWNLDYTSGKLERTFLFPWLGIFLLLISVAIMLGGDELLHVAGYASPLMERLMQ